MTIAIRDMGQSVPRLATLDRAFSKIEATMARPRGQALSPFKRKLHSYMIREMPLLRSVWFLGQFILCATGLLATSSAQTIPFEKNYRDGGEVPFANQWEGPASLRLASVNGGRTGTVWFRETEAGILLFARFSGGPPRWARSRIEMEQRDHVDIWLRTSLKVELPEIAWGNQFGFETCETYKSPRRNNPIEDCPTWQARQLEYRKPLARVFERLWRMAPGVSAEELATPALNEMLGYATDYQKESLSKLAPHLAPALVAAESPEFSYFETVIPWAAFPPTNTLSLDRIYIAIDFTHGDELAATTSPRKVPGEVPALAELSLQIPHVSELSACGYSLGSGAGGSWYIPNRGSKVLSSFRLENEQDGYRYDPEGLSPVPVWTNYFEKTVNAKEFICGPDLRYSVAGKLFSWPVHSIRQNTVSLRSMDGGGSHLLKAGPVMGTKLRYGSGQCGSCPTATLSMYLLDPIKGITRVFDENILQENDESDGDIQLSRDWKTITVYRAKLRYGVPAVWTFNRFCLMAQEYQECGTGPSKPPPRPRQIHWP